MMWLRMEDARHRKMNKVVYEGCRGVEGGNGDRRKAKEKNIFFY